MLGSVGPRDTPLLGKPRFGGDQLFVAVQVDGYEPKIERVTYVAEGEITVRLRRAGTLTGNVVDSEGAPVAECVIECKPIEKDSLAVPKSVRTQADASGADCRGTL
jgi:hypothetical protein